MKNSPAASGVSQDSYEFLLSRQIPVALFILEFVEDDLTAGVEKIVTQIVDDLCTATVEVVLIPKQRRMCTLDKMKAHLTFVHTVNFILAGVVKWFGGIAL